MTLVSVEEARRIALRAQLLDGSATSALDTIRRLGFSRSTRSRPSHRPRTLALLGAWGDTPWLEEALGDLAAWLGADRATAV